ncbi:MAG: bifunctional alpha/beta hydrolase/OsmC family protein [Alphaproteobacteria bacterium]|nr:osmotically inducible protein C [Rhodospirillaceae bacterium]MDP6404308.1 bifunctional alpha/beta hydrolase/OsmC family protein [Alphaproteobacteria bacterium]MDP6622378.1 bifunctional alpha/beta hydrolase/OsmC family protein [Alphaproteobacteria bacterium]|tara:strand:- start:1542 stop:2780 length:1239 start_codon:yes stop_codon:yes gene_type:complete
MAQSSEKITFAGADGDQLAARLDLPDGNPRAYALWAHCFSCTKDIFAASRVAAGLTARGIAVLRFDFTGLGASEGDFANTNFSSNVGDLLAAADHLREHFAAPRILIGHSLGGAAVLVAASRVPEAEAVCTIGAPADPAHVTNLFQDSRAEIEAKGEAEVLLAGRPFRIQLQFLEDLESQKLERDIAAMKKALLVFHSPIDATVGVENAARIFQAAKHPKSFVSLDDADHLLSRKVDATYVADVIAAWATRYVATEGALEEVSSTVTAAPGTVVVAEAGQGKFANRISIGGRHALRADEPAEVGGTDTGPTPYDLMLAGLGACKTMTMRLYAERKGYALERAQVTLSHDKIHARDCAECETEGGRIDRIAVEIELSGNLDAETRQKIAAIAEKCPVHRTLQSEVLIESRHKN